MEDWFGKDTAASDSPDESRTNGISLRISNIIPHHHNNQHELLELAASFSSSTGKKVNKYLSVSKRVKSVRRQGDKTRFVATFCQTNYVDVSPNVLGAFCIDSGLHCHTGEFVGTRIIGGSNEVVKTCPTAMGFGFAAGTTDGPEAFDFIQGDDRGNPFWKLVHDVLKTPGKEQIECQSPKPILLDTGEMKDLVLPIQILQIGQLAVLNVPTEFTTMADKRHREAESKAFGQQEADSHWRSSSPPSVSAHLSESDFPSIQASRSIPPKSRRLAAAVAPPARGLSALPPTRSPPTFLSSYTSDHFCYELPESNSKVGGPPSEQVSLSSLFGIPFRVACEIGPLGPVPNIAPSLPGVPGSPGSCACEVGASPRPGTHFPCQAPETPFVGLPAVLINPAYSSASSLGDSRLHSIIASQVDAQIQNGDDPGAPRDQPDAIVIPSGSPAPAGSLVAADRPLWSSVVKQDLPGGSESSVDKDPDRVSGDFGPNKDLGPMATDSLSPSISDAALLTSPNTQLSPVPISDVIDSSHSDLKSKSRSREKCWNAEAPEVGGFAACVIADKLVAGIHFYSMIHC
ncbi:hypothetical protein Nepgr_029688 [Nepenthes gracilis]|uniref:Neutral ceramidase n=1 Tax=Nepenthes gracilis TaxID=150966 RepID=A0AAD3TD15_NEPGR|nr:hypothetical protein Nepgr_029688 [Nepenthes gracilis]